MNREKSQLLQLETELRRHLHDAAKLRDDQSRALMAGRLLERKTEVQRLLLRVGFVPPTVVAHIVEQVTSLADELAINLLLESGR